MKPGDDIKGQDSKWACTQRFIQDSLGSSRVESEECHTNRTNVEKEKFVEHAEESSMTRARDQTSLDDFLA